MDSNVGFESPKHLRNFEDSILRHLQDTESHDWLGEITHWGTQAGVETVESEE